MLGEAKKHGATFVQGKVESVTPDETSGKLEVVYEDFSLKMPEDVLPIAYYDNVVFAIGPKLTSLKDVIGMPDLKIPLINEIHARVIIDDKNGVIHRCAPV
jgi:hypothetical protein